MKGYLDRLQGTNGDAFNKMAEDVQSHFREYEVEIRADERQKVIDELKEEGRLKPESGS